MKDYTKTLPEHIEKYIGENDLFLEIYEGEGHFKGTEKRPPLLFVHGAYTGSWMWSKYIPHFVSKGWSCYVMNMRSHYRSRVLDMTKISFEDYLEDIKEVISECGNAPIIIGFSMGGTLCQKLAETAELAGLVLVDTTICKEVYEIVPYEGLENLTFGKIIEPAPARDESFSIDESPEDIAFQKKYLSMEASKAIDSILSFEANGGISVDSSLITCPCLVISALSSEEDDRRGKAMEKYFNAEYTGLWNTTHTGLLVGQRYLEGVNRIMEWLGKLHHQ
jgi:pimeloyl-ACP methyl ester carboxylesterase